MIVTPAGNELLVVTQSDHAHLAAELLALFRLPELIDHPRRRVLIRAVREHDNGWRELDAAPPLDADSGWPSNFRSLPGEQRREVWSRGCRRYAASDPYLALLVTLHAQALHREPAGGDAIWRDWLEELEGWRGELVAAAAASPTAAASDYAWLALADTCSLAACEMSGRSFTAGGVRGRAAGGTLTLEPFPLAGRTTFRLPIRRIPMRRYTTPRELGRALADARWERRPLGVAPAGGG